MRNWILAGALAALALGGAAMAQSKEKESIEVGAGMPDFRLNDQDGKAVRLSEFEGKSWVVLAFFPKALTGG